MNGLTLCRTFWQEIAEPELKKTFPEVQQTAAAGLVGNGSECFGFDDEISKDHDWGTDFFLWLPESQADRIPELQQWKLHLLSMHPEYPQRLRSHYGANVGVMTVGDFYTQLIGCADVPQTISQWLAIPEENLAMAVNGAVFTDRDGSFSAVRSRLLQHYPQDLLRKKIAARCMMLAQTGQYNLERSRKRGHTVTSAITRMKFVEEAIHLVFLLNKTYKPYYKWAFPAMEQLPILAPEAAPLLRRIAETDDQPAMDALCALFADCLRTNGYSDSPDWFLASHGEAVHRAITDPLLRSLPPQFG